MESSMEDSHTFFVFLGLCFPIRNPFFISNLEGRIVTFRERVLLLDPCDVLYVDDGFYFLSIWQIWIQWVVWMHDI